MSLNIYLVRNQMRSLSTRRSRRSWLGRLLALLLLTGAALGLSSAALARDLYSTGNLAWAAVNWRDGGSCSGGGTVASTTPLISDNVTICPAHTIVNAGVKGSHVAA